jgi:hypothetical protein
VYNVVWDQALPGRDRTLADGADFDLTLQISGQVSKLRGEVFRIPDIIGAQAGRGRQ